jgi:hypothetical protein
VEPPLPSLNVANGTVPVEIPSVGLGGVSDMIERGETTFVVVSDHGMSPLSDRRVIFLDDYVDLKSIDIDFAGPNAGLRPKTGTAEHMSVVLFERDLLGEPLDGRLADQRACGPRARPCRVGFRSPANSIEGRRNIGDELVAQSWALLVVPQRCAAKLGTRFRMQFEAHVAVRVPSGSRSARSPS